MIDNSCTGQKPAFDLVAQGVLHHGPLHWNLTAPFLYEHAIRRREGEIGLGGAFVVNTGRHTGRSPRDKYIVDEPGTHETVAWGSINQPITPAQFASLHQRVLAYLQGRELFIQDLYAGADPE
jgi:phosphoenolpyruvate carboxykinase (ATP)